jgi:hypothetical protein
MAPLKLSLKQNIIITICATTLFTVIFLSSFRARSAKRHTIVHHLPYPKLHLLLPVNEKATKGGSGFCKTLLSVLVHGYEPIILNWDLDLGASAMQGIKIQGM